MRTNTQQTSNTPFFSLDFYRAVPAQLWESTAEVQSRTGILAKVSLPTPQYLTDFPELSRAPACLDIWPEQRSITVWVHSPNIPPHFLGHELIHLRRNILDSVPRLFPLAHAKNPELIHGLENDFEHLFVIPEEIKLFPNAQEHWARYYSELLANTGTNPFNWFRHWTVINATLPNELDLIQFASSRLREIGLLADAEEFRSAVIAAMPDKRRMLNVALATFSGLANDVTILRYAARDGQLHVIE